VPQNVLTFNITFKCHFRCQKVCNNKAYPLFTAYFNTPRMAFKLKLVLKSKWLVWQPQKIPFALSMFLIEGIHEQKCKLELVCFNKYKRTIKL